MRITICTDRSYRVVMLRLMVWQKMPTSLPSTSRDTLLVVTCTPFLNTLSKGPDIVMTLSPSTVTSTGMVGRPGGVLVQVRRLRSDHVGG